MNRKILSVLLALVLAFSCCLPALAESYVSYTHPDGIYSLEYPSDFSLMDKSNIDEVADLIESGAVEEFNSFAQYASSIRESNMVVFQQESGDNVNIVYADVGSDVSASDLILAVFPSLAEQYKGMLSGVVIDDPGTACTYGNYEYARLKLHYTLLGVELQLAQYYLTVNGTLYTFTFTFNGSIDAANQAIMEHMLSTFKVN